MRCPECTVRNSVAATQCKDCGAKLPQKGLPKDIVIAAGAFILVGAAAIGGLAMLPSLFDTEGNLQKVAKKVAQGPKSPADAERMRNELESGTRSFLEHNAEASSADLVAKLQKIFPSSAYEIHVAELPEKMRLVEIDTVLQSSNFLVSNKHVAVLRDFDVYDTSAVIADGANKTMILLGHGNAQDGRKPHVRLFTIQADGVKEKSDKAVPSFTGEGTAVLSKNGKDIDMELSLASRGLEEKLFVPGSYRAAGLNDETVHPRLIYRQDGYELVEDNGRSALAALRAAAFLVADPSQKDRFRKYLAPAAQDSLAGLGKVKVCPPSFQIKRKGAVAASAPANESRRHRRRHRHEEAPPASPGGFVFIIGNTDDAFEVVIAKDGPIYQTKQIRRVKALPISGDEGASVAATYEDKTSHLVDKLLSSPESHGSEAATTAAGTSGDSAPGIESLVKIDKTPSKPVSNEKIVEKKADAEEGTVSNKIDTATVKVRRGPSTGYRTIAEVPKGSALEILGKHDGWYKVRVNGKEGFIYGGYVNCKTNDAYTTAVVRGDKSVKDDRNRTVSHARAGERIVVIGGGRGDKYKVQLSSGRIGYVDKDALDMGGGADTSGSTSSESPPQFVP